MHLDLFHTGARQIGVCSCVRCSACPICICRKTGPRPSHKRIPSIAGGPCSLHAVDARRAPNPIDPSTPNNPNPVSLGSQGLPECQAGVEGPSAERGMFFAGRAGSFVCRHWPGYSRSVRIDSTSCWEPRGATSLSQRMDGILGAGLVCTSLREAFEICWSMHCKRFNGFTAHRMLTLKEVAMRRLLKSSAVVMVCFMWSGTAAATATLA